MAGTLETIRTYHRVVEAGGFAAAARRLGVSRSVVNKHVKQLEEALGTQLLRRSTRQVTPTEAGQAFYAESLPVVADLDAAMSATTALREEPAGQLRINAPMSFGITHLGHIAASYMATYPDVHVELVLSDRRVDPIEEGFDLTLRIGEPQSSSSLVTVDLATVHVVAVASPGYLAAASPVDSPAALSQHRCLHYGYQASGTRWHLTGAAREVSAHINCVMWSNNGDVLKAAAVAGEGIALLPDFLVNGDLAAGHLVRVLSQWQAPELRLTALHPRHRYQAAKVQRFVDLLTATFAELPATG